MPSKPQLGQVKAEWEGQELPSGKALLKVAGSQYGDYGDQEYSAVSARGGSSKNPDIALIIPFTQIKWSWPYLGKPLAPSFFKLKARKSAVAHGRAGGRESGIVYEHEAEQVQEGHIKILEIWNQSKEDPEVTSCIDFLKMIGRMRAKNSSYVGKMTGGAGYDKLWNHAIRKLTALAVSKWRVPTALPISPLIKTIRSDTGEMTIHPFLSFPFEDTLINAFPTCTDEQSKELAVDYCL